MAIKLEMLRCFAVVASTGSLAAAADFLGRTPSAVSMMLAGFEAHLGAPLFEGERKSRLTPFGLMTLAEAERAIAAFDGSVAAIGRYARSTAGTVRIAAVPSVSVTLLPQAIARFRSQRPDVRLEISDVDSAAVIRRIEADEADLGLASGPIGPGLESEILLTDALGIVCRPDHPVALLKGPIRWGDLERGAFLANPLAALVDHPGVRAQAEASHLVARNTTTLLAFVRLGLGATILPERSVDTSAADLLFFRPMDPPAERPVHLLQQRKSRLNPAAEAFRRCLAEVASLSPIEKSRAVL